MFAHVAQNICNKIKIMSDEAGGNNKVQSLLWLAVSLKLIYMRLFAYQKGEFRLSSLCVTAKKAAERYTIHRKQSIDPANERMNERSIDGRRLLAVTVKSMMVIFEMNIKATLWTKSSKRENAIDWCVPNVKENVQIKFTTKLIDTRLWIRRRRPRRRK